MRSSSGEHFIALDHVRAVATFMVFTWHFIHSHTGSPVPFEYLPSIFFFALLDEGHTGVALFMTLSGYLFAKLLDGKRVNYPIFYWDRMLRLFPLLLLVIVIFGYRKIRSENLEFGPALYSYALHMWQGFIFPIWPNGAWSIAIELHFYLLLPIFLWLQSRARFALPALLGAALLLRLWLHSERGDVQWLAYWTIVGRFDQFIMGIVIFQYRRFLTGQHLAALGVGTLFAAFYWNFDRLGGYAHAAEHLPLLWVYLPTLEGFSYAVLIAYYESSFSPRSDGLSGLLGKFGEYSYSIYLLHAFVVFYMAKLVQQYVMDISNFYLACLWAVAGFLLMYPLAYLSFRFIEAPFLKYRKKYTLPALAH